ncbi:uncharacterized protein K02A2.6-like [Gigantopelta aegis]|uniref:uncharacterized protein K02A2.6-like n=1 Tax=Gigantopelta aegis TaxID=1735272 RepID=UPI001B88E37B|nr:uncharacterized protein K02A2.6-like [Gigantopelta aegis]
MERMFCTHWYAETLKTDNGANFVSKEFEAYLSDHDIEHKRTTPLWPQANGEVERKNRTLLKVMQIAPAEKKNWKLELHQFLLAYRSTPHSTTGVSPSELMYGGNIRTKMPQLKLNYSNVDLQVEDRDRENKQNRKDYVDTRRGARNSEISPGDTVLLKQKWENKLSTQFANIPFKVIDKCGNQITVRSPQEEYNTNAMFHMFTNIVEIQISLNRRSSPRSTFQVTVMRETRFRLTSQMGKTIQLM